MPDLSSVHCHQIWLVPQSLGFLDYQKASNISFPGYFELVSLAGALFLFQLRRLWREYASGESAGSRLEVSWRG